MTRPRIVFMFSGQGSQYFQMGRELYDEHAAFRSTLERCDTFVHAQAGFSIIGETFARARSDTFDDLILSHPALVAFGLAMHAALLDEGIEPDLLLGSSLGELVCAAIAGCCSYEAALHIALEHAKNVSLHCASGGMLAVLGRPDLLQGLSCGGRTVTFAGENFPGHFTISATCETLDRIVAELKERNVTAVRLPVRYAFHSPAVEPARGPFMRSCAPLKFSSMPGRPTVSTMSAGRVERFDADYFWEVVRGPMRFRDTVLELEGQGPSVFIDCGPAGTCATFVRYNLTSESKSIQYPILSPFGSGVRNLEKVKQEVRRGHSTWRPG